MSRKYFIFFVKRLINRDTDPICLRNISEKVKEENFFVLPGKIYSDIFLILIPQEIKILS